MSLVETFARHRIIIQKLRSSPATFEELQKKFAIQSEISGRHYEISLRTFQRDIRDISELYNIEILFNKSTKKYQIVNNFDDNYSERLFEAFDIFQALQSKDDFSEFIQFDTRKPYGTEWLVDLLSSIRNKEQIEIVYQKFWKKHPENRILEPYLLKEFRRRWYVFAYDVASKDFRIFGLDRIQNIYANQSKFQHPQNIDPKDFFRDVFGIIGSSEDFVAQEIILAFRKSQDDSEDLPNQGEYIKSMPLHPSQEIIKDSPEEIIVKLFLKPNWEFMMEILYYGEYIEVLQPKTLRNKIKKRLEKATLNYN